jgi:hypothetical protein
MLYQLGSSFKFSFEGAIKLWEVLIQSFILNENASSARAKTVTVNKLMDIQS